MPSARHARMMRTAISPRLAMRRRRMGFTVRPEASMVDDRNDQRLAEHDLFGPQGVSSLHERPHLRITHERPGDPQRKGWIPKIPLVGYPGHDPGGAPPRRPGGEKGAGQTPAATASSWAVTDLATPPPTSNRIVPVNPHSAKRCLGRAGSGEKPWAGGVEPGGA